jgi:hypothetical protein
MDPSYSREQEAEVVVYLGGSSDGGTRTPGWGFLLNGYRRRDSFNAVEVGPVYSLEDLARIGRKRFDIASLALGIYSIERKAGLARTAHPADYGKPVVSYVEIDILQVMNAYSAKTYHTIHYQ